MKVLFIALAWTASMLCTTMTFAQQPTILEVGKHFPDFQVTCENDHHKKDIVSLNDFKGDWLMINVWSLGCMSSFKVFQNVKAAQQRYGDKMKFLFIGKNFDDFNQNIVSIFSRINSNMKMKVFAAYDSVLIRQWNIESYPVLFLINPEGVLKVVTDGRDLTMEKLDALMKGDQVKFYPGFNGPRNRSVNASDILNSKVLFSAVISECTGQPQHESSDLSDDDSYIDIPWSATNVPLYFLYNYAFFGKSAWGNNDEGFYGAIHPRPILDMRDTSAFSFSYKVKPAIGTYNCYINISGNGGTRVSVREELKQSLEKSFGYRVQVEVRDMPAIVVSAKAGAKKKLVTRTAKSFVTAGSVAGGFHLTNTYMDECVRLITSHLPNDQRMPVINETGIDGAVDFSIVADMTDLARVQEQIGKYGLKISIERRPMKVLVIRDH